MRILGPLARVLHQEKNGRRLKKAYVSRHKWMTLLYSLKFAGVFFGREGVTFVEGKVWNRFRRTHKQRVGASCLGNEKHLSKNRADKIPTLC